MLDEYGFELYEENQFPLAYLLTFRTFGTWLHGDVRWSVGKSRRGRRESRLIQPNVPLQEAMAEEMDQPAVVLNNLQRSAVESAIREVCEHREYSLRAVNARTNHVHSVVSAQVKPEGIINTFKAYSTRKLRDEHLIARHLKVWSRGRSRRYLWKPRHVLGAIDYVLYSQGWVPFEDWMATWTPPDDVNDAA
jgi:REP element-mobilizing transposase RayT